MARTSPNSSASEPSQPYDIYRLSSNRHVYIGSAWNKTAQQRWGAHYVGRSGAPALQDALHAGVVFRLDVLESGVGTLREAREREQYYLDLTLTTDPRKLLNLNLNPAQSGTNQTLPEVRAKMSESQQRRCADPVERARRSEVMREVMNRPEHIERMRETNPVRHLPQETRDMVTKKITGLKRSDESKQRYSATMKQRWSDPEYRERMRVALAASWAKRKGLM